MRSSIKDLKVSARGALALISSLQGLILVQQYDVVTRYLLHLTYSMGWFSMKSYLSTRSWFGDGYLYASKQSFYCFALFPPMRRTCCFISMSRPVMLMFHGAGFYMLYSPRWNCINFSFVLQGRSLHDPYRL